MDTSPLYLGFDLSTQQLKAVIINGSLEVQHKAKFDFDLHSTGFQIKNGVMVNEALHEVYVPVALWIQALDSILQQLKQQMVDFSHIKAISGAGQQHGSVYWSHQGEDILRSLNPLKSLEEQLSQAFSHPYAPNWQDASTQAECDRFDSELSSEERLAQVTGSKAHHRFTGPQILRFKHKHQQAYQKTARISLISSFLASLFLGRIASMDSSDVCGMNLWDIQAGTFHEQLLSFASDGEPEDLKTKLGPVCEDGGKDLGSVSQYFISRWGFSPSCTVRPFTGDNPATILALPLRPLDAILSLETSTTFLMSTPHYKPHPSVHFFNHPTTPGLYMFMLCYKNGGPAREQIRDALNRAADLLDPADPWFLFDECALNTLPLHQRFPLSPMKLGLYFPLPEIVPNLPAGRWRYTYDPRLQTLSPDPVDTTDAREANNDDASIILESQFLSIRLRSASIMEPVLQPDGTSIPAQPRRLYIVGGGAQNPAIANFAGNVLGGTEGVWRLDMGEYACALGAAYKALWAAQRSQNETFDAFIGKKWDMARFVKKAADGYYEGMFEQYGYALQPLEMMEADVGRRVKQEKDEAS